jgi:hypothetical protein
MRYVLSHLDEERILLTVGCGIALWTHVESAFLKTAYVDFYHPGIGECGGGGGG